MRHTQAITQAVQAVSAWLAGVATGTHTLIACTHTDVPTHSLILIPTGTLTEGLTRV